MNRYIALIRGINVGGKNKVSMGQLKSELEARGFERVISYINSGNIIFSSSKTDLVELVSDIETILHSAFSVSTKVAVIEVGQFHRAVKQAPSWWNKQPDDKHNALFIIAPATAETVASIVGAPKDEYEKVHITEQLIYWTAPLKTFSRTRWSKIVSTAAYDSVTIRNANTVMKLAALTQADL
jgi:uncharacterized protein (DUF1697 family)